MEIWSHVAGSTILLDDYLDNLDSNMPACFFPRKIIVYDPLMHLLRSEDELTVQMRNSLMAACGLSHLMTLEAWKHGISKISIRARPAGSWMQAIQGSKVKVVDELNAIVKGYMEGRDVKVVQIRQQRFAPE